MSRTTLTIVDDNSAMVDIVIEVASELGLDAKGHASGEAFLDALEGDGPDILLLDLQMPCLDGMELLTRLSERGVSSDIYIMSGTDGPVREAARYLGEAGSLKMSGTIAKPVRVAQLRERLQETLDRAQAG